MRRRGKKDSNQDLIVKELRARGYSVQSLASVGDGVPDILVGRGLINKLYEIKDKSSSRGLKLTDREEAWHRRWAGQVRVIWDYRQVLDDYCCCMCRRELSDGLLLMRGGKHYCCGACALSDGWKEW